MQNPTEGISAILKTTWDVMREIIDAAERGERIEFRPKDHDIDDVWRIWRAKSTFNFVGYEYRVKPKTPRVVWVEKVPVRHGTPQMKSFLGLNVCCTLNGHPEHFGREESEFVKFVEEIKP